MTENHMEQQSKSRDSEHQELAEWLRKVKFRRALIGGLNERDVWKKIGELNQLYEAALRAERARYDIMLEEQQKAGKGEGG